MDRKKLAEKLLRMKEEHALFVPSVSGVQITVERIQVGNELGWGLLVKDEKQVSRYVSRDPERILDYILTLKPRGIPLLRHRGERLEESSLFVKKHFSWLD
ncbi:MAG: hypothetical protein WB502_13470 [Thermoactinomyces sp.]|jgi:hypothetical protein